MRIASVVRACSLGITIMAAVACSGLLGKARIEPPAASEALAAEDKGCTEDQKSAIPDVGKPLVVDLQSSERGDLEVAMKESILVASYDCNQLKVLDECRIEGSYAYTGFLPKEELVRLTDKDELGANLPISAGTFGAKLGGDFNRGMTLDIAMMMVGKSRTTKRVARRSDLVEDRPGACAKATHFVRGVTHGAFAMTTGSKAESKGVAEIFGIPKLGKVGVSGGSSSSEDVSRKDGSLDACKAATTDASSPTASCSAILRLELSRIENDGAAPTQAPDPELTADTCGGGKVLAGGKCAAKVEGVAHLCKPGDVDDCRTQCDRGDGGSCSRLGYYHQMGMHDFAKDPSKAAGFFRKACELDNAVGCGSLAALYALGEGVAADPVKTEQLATKACEGGFETSCFVLGAALYTGNGVKKDPERAVRFLARACGGGAAQGCMLLGEAARKGIGQPKDPKRALELYRRGCDGADPPACYAVGVAYEDGIGTAPDKERAKSFFARACDGGLAVACEEAKK